MPVQRRPGCTEPGAVGDAEIARRELRLTWIADIANIGSRDA
jgi:hypothetical protein